MSALGKLLKLASKATREERPNGSRIPAELRDLLVHRNGFFAFEGALEIFPLGTSSLSYDLMEWNEPNLWKAFYTDLSPPGWCFGQDAFGGQFILNDNVSLFDPETGVLTTIGDSLESWADTVLNDYDYFTGYSLMHQWQEKHRSIGSKCRLVPKTPFVLGGCYEVDNLLSMDAAQALRIRGNLAIQLSDAPDGSRIIFDLDE